MGPPFSKGRFAALGLLLLATLLAVSHPGQDASAIISVAGNHAVYESRPRN